MIPREKKLLSFITAYKALKCDENKTRRENNFSNWSGSFLALLEIC